MNELATTNAADQPPQRETAMEIASARASQEVQAAMVVAKKFPRDETQALSRILRSCKRSGLAEAGMYAYKKGGQMVTGPSIRLAEAMAQSWGNIDYGVIELSQNSGESQFMSYAWDLETNTRSTKVFTVKHERHTRNGVTKLHDPRDIYEVGANQGARRVRACILAVIPGDIQDQAIRACEDTLSGGGQVPLKDRIRNMVIAFENLGVTADAIERRIQHPVQAINEPELTQLGKIYTSIKDGMSKREEWFDLEGKDALATEGSKSDGIAKSMAKGKLTKPQQEALDHLDELMEIANSPSDIQAAYRTAIKGCDCYDDKLEAIAQERMLAKAGEV